MSQNTQSSPIQSSYTPVKRGFAESVIHDAFNVGVHEASIDATNYVLLVLALFIALTLHLTGFSWHYSAILGLVVILGVSMNLYRNDILAASEDYLRKEQEKKEKAAVEQALIKAQYAAKHPDQVVDDDEDGEYEYEYIYEDEDDESTQDKDTQDQGNVTTNSGPVERR